MPLPETRMQMLFGARCQLLRAAICPRQLSSEAWECLLPGEFRQLRTLLFQRHARTQKLLPEFPDVLHKRSPLRPELPLQFLAQSCRHGRIKKIAVLRIVNYIAEYTLGLAGAKHSAVGCGGIGGCHH